ncbi:hypothetical protein LCGC14_2346670 [marine sediment metagenome]|uniref:Uncharacterized protein n=1 Tax=marine sediment metagenome TaxID=412755 RepID=A0A0F9F5K0_9ZZZZ
MAKQALSGPTIWIENAANLSAVVSATNGAAVETRWYKNISVFVNVSVNTGAVTVNIEASHDGSNWFNLDSKTYTAATGTDIFGYSSHFPHMRTTTTTQSNSTVTTTITGRN